MKGHIAITPAVPSVALKDFFSPPSLLALSLLSFPLINLEVTGKRLSSDFITSPIYRDAIKLQKINEKEHITPNTKAGHSIFFLHWECLTHLSQTKLPTVSM